MATAARRRRTKKSRRKRRSSVFKWKLVSAFALVAILGLTCLWYFGRVEEYRAYLRNLPSAILTDSVSNGGLATTDGDRLLEILIYFGNSRKDPETLDCSLVFPVRREVREGPAIARQTLEALLEGPLMSEKAKGYYSSLNRDSRLESLEIEGGLAIVNFDESFVQGIAGSCQVQAIKAQINQTLLQFDSVSEVQILVEGKVSTSFQP